MSAGQFIVSSCRLLLVVSALFATGLPARAAEPDRAPTTQSSRRPPGSPLSEAEFFAAINLDHPGLDDVKHDISAGDFASARKSLAAYYRSRAAFYDSISPSSPDVTFLKDQLNGNALPLLEHTGNFAPQYWLPTGQLDLRHAPITFPERLYYWESIAHLYRAAHDPRLARAWVTLLHSFIDQIPYDPDDAWWRTMHVGIQLRSAMPAAFRAFLRAPEFSDADVYAFLKSTLERTQYLRINHNLTSNQLTFEMAGLYTSGVMYPEFKDADDWRHFAATTALADLHIGWLPDGMSIELSPGYGQFFSNYYAIYDLAKSSARLHEFDSSKLLSDTQTLYETYLKIMTPDRLTPATNDNAAVDVPRLMTKALERFPTNAQFQWAATAGRQGAAPSFTSCILPYAGFAAMRSNWSRDANLLYFDFGPLGYRHAHQDKLQVLLWSYGRPILFDSGRGHYNDAPPRMQNYALDTFSHSTLLVDNRPQRRPWYANPFPSDRPYQPVQDYTWTTNSTFDYAAGVYSDAYGLPGESDADPYKPNSNFDQGWTHPAVHHRRILFYKPDIFIVADTLVPSDSAPHTYDARWQIASLKVPVAKDLSATTQDTDQPNLQIIPLSTTGLTVKSTSAQTQPEILGWNAADTPRPATTLQHLKSATGVVQFVTLLTPLKPGTKSIVQDVKTRDESNFILRLQDGRRLEIHIEPNLANSRGIVVRNP